MIALLRWLLGLLCGFVAAAFLFALAALLAGRGAAGPVGLLALGFGVAFFPIVFASGTRLPRHVLRRAAIAVTLEGLAVAAIQGYQMATNAPLLSGQSFAWAQSLAGFGESLISQVSPVIAVVAGVIMFLVGLVLFLVSRPSGAPAATAPRKAAPSATTERGPAVKAPPAAPKALPDEDAQLMADLENMRKKLPK